jgi:hypothetical protein
MKIKVSAIFLIFFSSLKLYCQNTEYFKDKIEYVYSLNNSKEIFRIDSVVQKGSLKIFYPSHRIVKYSDNCYHESDFAFVGFKIELDANGDYYFYNRMFDKALIKPYSNLNEKWIVYHFKNGNNIIATINQINRLLIFGETDSVKIIKFELQDSVGNVLIKNYCSDLKIGVKFGFYEILNFRDFPDISKINSYILFDNSEINNDTSKLTAKKIFNYDIGDEFHTEEYSCANSGAYSLRIFRISKILNKRISQNQDTLHYEIEICQKQIKRDYGVENYYYYKGASKTLIILSDYKYLDYLPNEIYIGRHDYIFTEQFYDEKTNLKAKCVVSGIHKRENDSCLQTILVDRKKNSRSDMRIGVRGLVYFDGILGDFSRTYFTAYHESYTNLLYYKKRNQTVGSPLICDSLLVGISNCEPINKCKIYPNPTNDVLYISNLIDHSIVKIYDLNGKELLSKASVNLNESIDISKFENGVYIVKISDIKTVNIFKFLKN